MIGEGDHGFEPRLDLSEAKSMRRPHSGRSNP
jgi:hypothetical protein